jgi:methylaspartate ammonia-lyase
MEAKPGMGVDEGLAIVRNEMARALRLNEYFMTVDGVEVSP